MKQDELDRILVSEEQIEPSAAFSESVMNRIREEGKPFPWILFLAFITAVTIMAIAFFPAEAVLQAENVIFQYMVQWITGPMDATVYNALLALLVSLSGTMLLIWASLRFAGAGR